MIGVIVFIGLTAWDTQRINEVYLESDPGDVLDKKALMGALTLYLDFINLTVATRTGAGRPGALMMFVDQRARTPAKRRLL